MESKLKQQCQDSVGERTEFTPAIINKRFHDFSIPENAKVTAIKIGDKVATCVEELPAGYLHLPTKPIEISVKYDSEPKADAWNDAGTKPDHHCLCRSRVYETDWPEYYNYWNGNFWGLTATTKENAIDNKDIPTSETNIQWREVQP